MILYGIRFLLGLLQVVGVVVVLIVMDRVVDHGIVVDLFLWR